MPGKRTARVRGPRPAPEHEQEEGAPVTKSPRLESDETEPMGPGRPHQAFVESEARKYWQDMVKVGSLAKPDRQEIRTAAMPILIKCLQKRGWVRFLAPTVKAHMAVNVMHMHAVDRGELTGRPVPSPDHIEALIRYADGTRLLAREIPLPEHPDPQHPVIYYTAFPGSNRPIPRDDSYIRGDYVYEDDTRVTTDDRIFPLVIPEGEPFPDPSILLNLGWASCFTLEPDTENIEVRIHWLVWYRDMIMVDDKLLKRLNFTP